MGVLRAGKNLGRIVYTRWDILDRNYGSGHHLWLCTHDGRDPRNWHGNSPFPHSTMDGKGTYDGRADRPWAEYQFRAIPGTLNKYIAIAGGHHDAMPGVPIIVDISIEDDNAMAQVKNITGACFKKEPVDADYNAPPCSFNGLDDFATPWPLSEDYYLVARSSRNEEGLFILDKFGNLELLYSGIAASPRPLQPRTPPELSETATFQGERRSEPHTRAVISVRNIYESDFDWPENTVIKAMRILHVVPKPWSHYDQEDPVTGFGSHCPVREVLGTVPVEADGSAYFEAPVEKMIYFQALDSNGMAVQSMRSGTYVHPGEHLHCTGCHEDKWKASGGSDPNPIAFSRAPSPISPGADGTNPLNFHRLVKPIFQEKCVPCHVEKGKGPTYLADYGKSLGKIAFFFSSSTSGGALYERQGGHRTTAGRFGAHESTIGKALLATHRDRVSAKEFERVVTWLDANSMELGAYRNADEQRGGQIVWPLLRVDPDNPTGIEKGMPPPETFSTGPRKPSAGPTGSRVLAGGIIHSGGDLFFIPRGSSGKDGVRIDVYNCRGRLLASEDLPGLIDGKRYRIPVRKTMSSSSFLVVVRRRSFAPLVTKHVVF